jgi:hypothetical protein
LIPSAFQVEEYVDAKMSELREMLVGGGSDVCVPTNTNAKDGGVGVVIHHSGRPQAETETLPR